MSDDKPKSKADRFPPRQTKCGGSNVVGKKKAKKKKADNKPVTETKEVKENGTD